MYSFENLRGVEYIKGSLYLGYFDADRHDLSALESIQCIRGDLIVQHTEHLNDLSALANLRRVGGDIYIQYNENLQDLWALENLETFRGDFLFIKRNDELSDCYLKYFYESLVESGWEGEACIVDNNYDGCRGYSDACEKTSSLYW
jgi:hypothetical protein